MQILMTPSAKSVAFLQGRDGARGGDRVAIVALAIGLAGSGTGHSTRSSGGRKGGTKIYGCIDHRGNGMDSNNNSRNLSGIAGRYKSQGKKASCKLRCDTDSNIITHKSQLQTRFWLINPRMQESCYKDAFRLAFG